jgi:hypothetical protein
MLCRLDPYLPACDSKELKDMVINTANAFGRFQRTEAILVFLTEAGKARGLRRAD